MQYVGREWPQFAQLATYLGRRAADYGNAVPPQAQCTILLSLIVFVWYGVRIRPPRARP
jgi:hypothetical protein